MFLISLSGLRSSLNWREGKYLFSPVSQASGRENGETANFAKFTLSSVCVQQLYITISSLPQIHWMVFFLCFPTVWYQKLDSGKSPNVSNQVIKNVKSKFRVRFRETTGQDHKVSILLCPVMSRIGSDAEAAIASIKGKGLCPPNNNLMIIYR